MGTTWNLEGTENKQTTQNNEHTSHNLGFIMTDLLFFLPKSAGLVTLVCCLTLEFGESTDNILMSSELLTVYKGVHFIPKT